MPTQTQTDIQAAKAEGYQASEYGMRVLLDGTWHVLSYINGSMCLNLPNTPIDASQFDEYLPHEYLMRFNPQTMSYEDAATIDGSPTTKPVRGQVDGSSSVKNRQAKTR